MELPDFDNVFATYQKEIVLDLQLDELSLKDRTMMVPTIKHKWVARLMQHKAQHKKLTEAKKKAVKAVAEASAVQLTKAMAEAKASVDPTIAKIQTALDSLDVLIEYLEKIERMTASLTFDCKNVIDIQKLETT